MSKLKQIIKGLRPFDSNPEVDTLIQTLKDLANSDSYPSNEFIDNLRIQANRLIAKNSSGQNNELVKFTLPVFEILAEFKPEEDAVSKIGTIRYGFFAGLPLTMLAQTEFKGQALVNIGFGPQRSKEVTETLFLADAVNQASHCRIKL